ncbi:MAG: SCP2 sterol-binding domain-containing protein [Candidatus Scalindua sp.]|jgi:putative sterol carrier protein|nr:SCP2 sterol-binding domain-containing protein [Candidatus Scalindua sp.]MBT5304834.1 SCP2 sterol-binding domain-containing protein [Candidatus Scalindua sp.]MBT6053086.1 SCP2 sterol-binding domain-containing protein [Candidatus Scalindua sp.]MBT6228740.1 SCP2 sterol-binding domain-containing protein [Candidatus Scalindua sp.]MBT6560895.1 SCP2 sterol-binding domain-containing protein [Candidatus Scalindua sp.]
MIDIKPGDFEKRPDIANGITPVEYFEQLIFARVNFCSLPKIESLNTVIRFDIDGDNGGSWTIVVEGGHLTRVVRNSPEICSSSNETVLRPVSTFRMDCETFMSILKREFTPQKAFFKRKVKIAGNIMIALKMNVLVNYL